MMDTVREAIGEDDHPPGIVANLSGDPEIRGEAVHEGSKAHPLHLPRDTEHASGRGRNHMPPTVLLKFRIFARREVSTSLTAESPGGSTPSHRWHDLA